MEAKSLNSIMNFNASHLHNGLMVSCSAAYNRPAGQNDLINDRSLTMQVLCEYTSEFFFIEIYIEIFHQHQSLNEYIKSKVSENNCLQILVEKN